MLAPIWFTDLIHSHKIVKDASSNFAHRESPQGPDERRGATSVGTPLTTNPHNGRPQHKGGETQTVGTVGSPHGGTPARESHARSVGCGGHFEAVLLCFIDTRWRKIRNKDSSLTGILSKCFCFVCVNFFGILTEV